MKKHHSQALKKNWEVYLWMHVYELLAFSKFSSWVEQKEMRSTKKRTKQQANLSIYLNVLFSPD